VNQLLTVREVGERLRLRDPRVVRKLLIGTGRAVRLGARLWLAEADLVAILDAHRVPAPGPPPARSPGSHMRCPEKPQLLPEDWWQAG
jgi:hypothetical protein